MFLLNDVKSVNYIFWGNMQNDQEIEDAIPYLKNNIHEIHTVSEWAHAWGYTRGHFSNLIKRVFKESPYTILRREKFKKVKLMVHKNPERKGRVIAVAAGFSNVKALYQFLNYHYGTTLTNLRQDAK